MGLAIAKGIVEAHSGRIWIEDGTAGRGARIVFTVPVGDEELPRDTDVKARQAATLDERKTEDLSTNGE